MRRDLNVGPTPLGSSVARPSFSAAPRPRDDGEPLGMGTRRGRSHIRLLPRLHRQGSQFGQCEPCAPVAAQPAEAMCHTKTVYHRTRDPDALGGFVRRNAKRRRTVARRTVARRTGARRGRILGGPLLPRRFHGRRLNPLVVHRLALGRACAALGGSEEPLVADQAPFAVLTWVALLTHTPLARLAAAGRARQGVPSKPKVGEWRIALDALESFACHFQVRQSGLFMAPTRTRGASKAQRWTYLACAAG